MRASITTAGAARGWRAGLLPGLGFALATLVLTWPLARAAGRAVSVRSDYFVQLWNFWWVRTALFERGVSPYWTDMLQAPLGISLARHTLSMANALPGALLMPMLGPDDAFRCLLLLHFWLSAWIFYALARELGTGTGGAIFAGLLWSFGPYHAYYMAQLNLATLEVLPLAALFTARLYRRGGSWNTFGLALAALLLAATDAYYLVYAALLCALLVLGGRLWEPNAPWLPGLRRVALAAPWAVLAVALGAWPLLADVVGASTPALIAKGHAVRSNDLLGFLWVGWPERVRLSWPTFLGYTTLGVLLAGWRGVLRQPFWLLALALFFVLGLGPQLRVAGIETGFPLPYALFGQVPVLSMLRKPDRFAVLVLFCAAVLVAWAWRDLAARLPAGPLRAWLWAGIAALMCWELSPAPLRTFAVEPSPHLLAIAADSSDGALLDLPFYGASPLASRSNRDQIAHGRPIAGGYVTSLALGDAQRREEQAWREATRRLDAGDAGPLLQRLEETGTQWVVLHKLGPRPRKPRNLGAATLWLPFALMRRDLIEIRQLGHLSERLFKMPASRRRRRALDAALGAPRYEDARAVVYGRP